jgi:2-hydroxy-3-keto-5-methylthiopentenyl-1-phosphate phosphatase
VSDVLALIDLDGTLVDRDTPDRITATYPHPSCYPQLMDEAVEVTATSS